jgi:hypothetical protein
LTATERLDEEKLATLRRWGEGLCSDDRDEVRAAGRAIVLLVEEVERLHVDLWHDRRTVAVDEPVVPVEEAVEGERHGLVAALRARLRDRAQEESPAP